MPTILDHRTFYLWIYDNLMHISLGRRAAFAVPTVLWPKKNLTTTPPTKAALAEARKETVFI